MNFCSFIGHKWVTFNSLFVLEYLELALGQELAKLPPENVLLLIEQLSKNINQKDLIIPDIQSVPLISNMIETEILRPHIDYIVKYTQMNIDPILSKRATIERAAELQTFLTKADYLHANGEYQQLKCDAVRVTLPILPFFAKIRLSACMRCNVIHDPRTVLKPVLSKIYQALKLEKINVESGFFAL